MMKRSLDERSRWVRAGLLAAPIVVFVLHSSLFHEWIVDDAGISFAYARNLAQGEGLVAQPGMEPVEGFSNLAWVLLMVPFYALHLFSPVVCPKLISLVWVVFTFLLLQWTLTRSMGLPRCLASFVLLLTALNPGYVIWCSSGLENALYAAEVVGLLTLCCLFLRNVGSEIQLSILSALLVFLCAMTRPDGILYAPAFPLVLGIRWMVSSREGKTVSFAPLAFYSAVILLLMVFLALFRFFYFGSLLPNTYYAKSFPLVENLCKALLLDWEEPALSVIKLFISVFGRFCLWGILGWLGFGVWLLSRRSFRSPELCLFLFLGLSICVYATLPRDWMGEYRFATPFFPLVYAAMMVTLNKLQEETRERIAAWSPRLQGVLFACLLLVLAFRTIELALPRTKHFLRAPTTPLSRVVEDSKQFCQLAEYHGLKGFSVLSVDVGGLLLENKFKVIDLGGLTDRKIAETFLFRRDQKAFYDYIFDEARPTILYGYGCWARAAKLREDERLEILYEELNPSYPRWRESPFLDLFLLRPEYRQVRSPHR